MFVFIFFLLFLALLAVGALFLYKKIKQNMNSNEDKEIRVPTTQDNLPMDYIRRGIIKMKNGSYAAVVRVPSINIELMEDEERQVVFAQYRQILTAIDFPFQFLQQSRIVDVSDYLKNLEKIQRTSDNQFIRTQLEYYKNFIVNLIETRSVLTKRFYIVIPFDELKEKKKRTSESGSLFDFQMNKKKKNQESQKVDSNAEEEKKFEIAYKNLTARANLIIRSFSRFDIDPELLNDSELTDLFYTSYNKSRSVVQPLRKEELKDGGYYSSSVKKGRG